MQHTYPLQDFQSFVSSHRIGCSHRLDHERHGHVTGIDKSIQFESQKNVHSERNSDILSHLKYPAACLTGSFVLSLLVSGLGGKGVPFVFAWFSTGWTCKPTSGGKSDFRNNNCRQQINFFFTPIHTRDKLDSFSRATRSAALTLFYRGSWSFLNSLSSEMSFKTKKFHLLPGIKSDQQWLKGRRKSSSSIVCSSQFLKGDDLPYFIQINVTEPCWNSLLAFIWNWANELPLKCVAIRPRSSGRTPIRLWCGYPFTETIRTEKWTPDFSPGEGQGDDHEKTEQPPGRGEGSRHRQSSRPHDQVEHEHQPDLKASQHSQVARLYPPDNTPLGRLICDCDGTWQGQHRFLQLFNNDYLKRFTSLTSQDTQAWPICLLILHCTVLRQWAETALALAIAEQKENLPQENTALQFQSADLAFWMMMEDQAPMLQSKVCWTFYQRTVLQKLASVSVQKQHWKKTLQNTFNEILKDMRRAKHVNVQCGSNCPFVSTETPSRTRRGWGCCVHLKWSKLPWAWVSQFVCWGLVLEEHQYFLGLPGWRVAEAGGTDHESINGGGGGGEHNNGLVKRHCAKDFSGEQMNAKNHIWKSALPVSCPQRRWTLRQPANQQRCHTHKCKRCPSGFTWIPVDICNTFQFPDLWSRDQKFHCSQQKSKFSSTKCSRTWPIYISWGSAFLTTAVFHIFCLFIWRFCSFFALYCMF